MDLQTRKLNVIEYLIGLKDDRIFSMFEEIVKESKLSDAKINSSFTRQELIERANISNHHYSVGDFKDQEQLETESKNW